MELRVAIQRRLKGERLMEIILRREFHSVERVTLAGGNNELSFWISI